MRVHVKFQASLTSSVVSALLFTVAGGAQSLNDIRGQARICDLRGNPGGAVATLERVAGHLLGKDVVLADRKGRKKEKPIVSRGPSKPIAAKLVILVDSDSGSAAEILSR